MDERLFVTRKDKQDDIRPDYDKQHQYKTKNCCLPRRCLEIKFNKDRQNRIFFNKKRIYAIETPENTSFNRKTSKKSYSISNFKTMVKLFSKRSSVYALSQVGNSTTTKRQVFWMLILILGTFGCIGLASQFLVVYFKYPVVTNRNYIREIYQEFPAVTVCNLNNIREEYMHCMRNKLSYDECFNGKAKVVPENSSEPLCIEAQNINNIAVSKKYIWLSQVLAQDINSRSAYGHQIENFILNCTFNSKQCNHEHFKMFFSQYYGNCFTFNYIQDGKRNTKLVRGRGPKFGLDLELDLEVDKYNPHTDEIGARVEIHDPYLQHNIEEEGVNISPGYKTYIGLSKHASERLPPPYKDHCRYYAVNESRSLCMELCEQNIVFSACSCIVPKKHIPGFRMCDLSKPSVFCCLLKLGRQYDGRKCNCPLPCHEAFYQYRMSYSAWPSRSFYNDNLNKFNDQSETSYLSFEKVRRTRLKVAVYFETLDSTVNKQNAMFQSSELFSQVGGQMGLWLGISLAAIFEFIENFITLIKHRMSG